MKGAAETDDLLKIRIQLMKPVTWIPLIWGVVCGAAASGNYHWANPFNVRATVQAASKQASTASLFVSCVCGCADAYVWMAPHNTHPLPPRTHSRPSMEQQDAPDAVPLSLGLEDFAKSLACMLLAGPLLTGFTQVRGWV